MENKVVHRKVRQSPCFQGGEILKRNSVIVMALTMPFILLTSLALARRSALHYSRACLERERRFLADASHELKTPLTVINANAQMLRRWADCNEQVRRESLEVIISETANLALFVDEMLSLARIDSGEGVSQEKVDLARLCEELVNGLRARITAKPIKVQMTIPGDRRQIFVWGNQALLRRVFSALLDNALKFTQAGEITLRLTRRAELAEVMVSDTGIGIPAESLEHVFERRYRTDHSRTREVEGFGLGLSIAKAFVQLHRGVIFAESRPGEGTNVYVQLPIDESSDISSCAD
jgi:signal transduction histidine kinase